MFQFLQYKRLGMFFGLFMALMLNYSVAYAAGPHEAENPPCYDVSGQGKLVSLGNSGVLDFDFATTYAQPAMATYEGCVRMDGTNTYPSHVEGWAWDNNLGWISMYCKAGMNLGVACGAQPYGVTVSTTPASAAEPYTNVNLNGYAWGDNVGYMSFNCSDNASCLVSSYGIQLIPTAGSGQGFVDSVTAGAKYVWADSVQWFDLSGVRFPWTNVPVNLVKICTIADPTCVACNLATGCDPVVTNKTPLANGVENIKIQLPYTDAGVDIVDTNVNFLPSCNATALTTVTPAPPGLTYAVCLQLDWNDTVSLDQTTGASQDPSNECNSKTYPDSGLGGVCPVKKPLFLANFPAPAGGYKSFNVTSIAPTSDANIETTATTRFYNEKFIYPENAGSISADYDGTKFASNTLKLASLKYMVFKYQSGINPGVCVIGTSDGTNCNPVSLSNIQFPFKPALALDNLYQALGGKNLNFISAAENSDLFFDFAVVDGVPTGATDKNVTLLTGLQGDEADKYDFNFIVGEGGGSSLEVSFSNSQAKAVIKLKDEENSADLALVQPYLYSKVTYTIDGNVVKFFSGKLPRLAAGFVKNPVMQAVGTVYSSAKVFNKSNADIRSLGSVATNEFREMLVRQAANATAGNGGVSSGDVLMTGYNGTGFTFFGSQLVALKNNVYLVKGDLTIDCPPGCTWQGKWTIVVDGGNVFIKSNVYPTDANAKLGLIVLKDLSSNKNDGNIFVDASVTDLKVNMYADRALLSYDAVLGFNPAAMEPIFADDAARQESLKNQLIIVGSLSSMNCIGCASSNPPYDGEGATVTGNGSYATAAAPSAGIARARTFDLNFMRYYGPYLEVCADNSTPVDQQRKGEPDLGCNSSDPAYLIDATNLVDPAGGDLILPAALEGKKSQYYSSDSSKYSPVYFIYQSAQGLPLFESNLDINPTQVN